jgi:hypothetical protein
MIGPASRDITESQSNSPIVSYGAFDLPTYFLDLTPFVPTLTDGNPHNFTLDVASAETDHTINGNWFVSGLLQVITDSSPNTTTGNITSYIAEPYATTTTSGTVGDDGEVVITVTASRQITIEAEILSGSGKSTNVVWSQDLNYSNTQHFMGDSNVQVSQSYIVLIYLVLKNRCHVAECCPNRIRRRQIYSRRQ